MPKLFPYLFPLLLLNFGISVGFGVNLRKWYGWAQIVASFLGGWLIAWPNPNEAGRIVSGVFFAILTILMGSIAWKRRHG
jgi:hypothetical protein